MSEVLAPAAPAAALADPIIELRGVSKRFSKTLDFAARFAKRLGANVREEIVHAVDGVDLTVRKGRWSASSARAAAASRRSAAWSPASCRRATAASSGAAAT
ncbi:hypothetical protein ACFQY5_07825 [Paeniroseomonas aquatica]|uniref:hypothetical protein n=1 Tax=Paeniroseomonas aquatica TaxID=373043 RepID=UPI003606AA57